MVRVLSTERGTSTYEDERNAYVMESLEQAKPMILNFAIRYRDVLLAMDADFEDLYQDVAEEALKYYEHAMCAENPRAYLQTTIRHACLRCLNLKKVNTRKRQLSDFYQVVSLNAPLTPDSDAVLESVVASIDSISREYPQEVYDAIESLPEKYCVPLCMRYGLFGYPSHT